MGQRLVISIMNDGEMLAKLYYHWSAFTTSALMELLGIAESVDLVTPITTVEDRVNRIIDIIRYAEGHGGGIDGGIEGREGKCIQELFPLEKFKNNNISRDNGLVAITPDGMECMQSVSEGDIYYEISSGAVINYVSDFYINKEELSYEYDLYDDIDIENIKEIPYDISHFDISDLADIVEFLNDNADNIYTIDGGYISLIG